MSGLAKGILLYAICHKIYADYGLVVKKYSQPSLSANVDKLYKKVIFGLQTNDQRLNFKKPIFGFFKNNS
ncbi:hypothetical protein LDL59_02960 [Kaistella anthropi]|nr:hypothetical protein [Kaistella anthropi]